nr:hypothetical protein [Aidingimonas halophila]
MLVPVAAPANHVFRLFDGLAVVGAIFETPGRELRQALSHIGRSVRPVPDEQADASRIALMPFMARHQADNVAAGTGTPHFSLNVSIPAQVELALQYDSRRWISG